MKPKTQLLTFLMLFVGVLDAYSQVVVFSDDFSDNTDPLWTTSGNLSGSAWDVFRSGVDFGVRRNDTPVQLEITNDISGTANVSGWAFASTSTSLFTSPYNTTLGNGGVVTWTFNMRQIRTDPSGFDSGNYGVAFILAAESATTNATGNGYAVVLGQANGTDPVRLVRYTTGITGNAGITNIIASNTTGLTDFGLEYLSVKVVYNPCLGGTWELYLRNDGLTAFADPLSGTLTFQGSAIDNTYTGSALGMMAAYWNASTAGNQPAFFNNVTVSVVGLPAATIGANPSVCSGITSANLPYTNPTGGANQYTIDWSGAAEAQGFSDLPLTSLPASPIVLTVPSGAAPATYTGDLILINSTTTCESILYPISVTINPLPVVGCPNDTILCSNEPTYTLGGGTPLGGTFSGTGVSAGMFNPALASPGVNLITYTFTDVNLCSNNCVYDITVNTAPIAMAGSYGPACDDDPDITLTGMPVGGTWTGQGVTGNMFDPSFGTETLTYTFTTVDGCTDSDQTTIMVVSCADPSTMRWVLLESGQNMGPCQSISNCANDRLCFGLEYTPLFTGLLTSYTTGFYMDCNNSNNPMVSNISCVMNNNSPTQNNCASNDSIYFNSSGNSGVFPVTAGLSVIIHQICVTIPSTGTMSIIKDNFPGLLSASIDSANMGGFENDPIQNYTTYVVDSLVACGLLPLTWLDFTAKAGGEFISDLEWTTADEINTSHFEIQRSTGAGFAFQTIGRVEADDVVRNVHEYYFTDTDARPGKNYYRIKQVDYDGRYTYSVLRTVTFNASKFEVDVWPNPAKEMITVYIHQAVSAGQIVMVDMAGRIIHEQSFDGDEARHEIESEKFNPGVYTLVVTSGDNRHVQKLVIID